MKNANIFSFTRKKRQSVSDKGLFSGQLEMTAANLKTYFDDIVIGKQNKLNPIRYKIAEKVMIRKSSAWVEDCFYMPDI